jgi:hypothetical protein
VNDLDAGLIEYVVTALEENQIALKADEVDNSEFIRDLSNFDDEEVRSPGP